ncbi:MAG: aspartyl protease family protein [Proteobacteria bacterium]|nr:aspartyl protease family protein [Pseudomonadota bacterium]
MKFRRFLSVVFFSLTAASAVADVMPASSDESEVKGESRASQPPTDAAPTPPAEKPDENCTLGEIAVLKMHTELSGLVTVPVTIDGVEGRWMVDTGNVTSMVSDTFATREGLRRLKTSGGTFLGGIATTEVAIARSVDFAGQHIYKPPLFIVPESIADNDTLGILSPDILRHFDVDFDFAAGQMHLFSPQHCPGKVVYWTNGGYARIPISMDEEGHPTAAIDLDGKELTAIIDTGSQNSVMPLDLAKRLFHIGAKDTALKSLGVKLVNGTKPMVAYRYPFKQLTLGAIQVGNPDITIVEESGLGDQTPQLVLGIETLRQLHLYIAYREGAMYVTPAEAR